MYGKKYCMFCKRLISKDSDICPHCGKDISKKKDGHLECCRYCNILIPSYSKYCEYCGTPVLKNTINIDDNKVFDYKTTLVVSGGNCFSSNLGVHIFLKNDRLDFQTLGRGNRHYNIKEDFVLCEKLSLEKIRCLKLLESKKYFSLIFNEDNLIFEIDDNSEEFISKIYNIISNQVYETENIFYNTEHNKFSIF